MKAPFLPLIKRPQGRRGAALVIVLSVLILLSAVVLAYFGQTMVRRQISFSSAGQTRADQVALSGLEFIKSDLVDEMRSASSTEEVAQHLFMNPTSRASMVPYRLDRFEGYPSLVKWSTGMNLWPANGDYASAGPIRATTSNISSNPSANGRYIDAVRWNKPALHIASDEDGPPSPSWVLLTRKGLLGNGSTALSNLSTHARNSATNEEYVIGRYAYRIYDVGGLLDVNAVGYPASLSSDEVGRKGSPGTIDLTQIGLAPVEIDALVTWRNATTGASPAAYRDYLREFGARYGFLQTAGGDQSILSRQDLIRFWDEELVKPHQTQREFLARFTSFSRELNAPSWGPTKSAQELGGNNSGIDGHTGGPQPNVYDYASRARQGNAVENPIFPKVRVTRTFTRRDGSLAVIGEPLVKNRFDLSKLSWIRHDGALPAGITTADIRNYFGLTRGAGGEWVYQRGSSRRILRLDEVAEEQREPDFFELLHAGILHGGLGLVAGDPTAPTGANGGEYYRRNIASWNPPLVRSDSPDGLVVHSQAKYQVMQLGANIIDQFDEDGYPTELVFNNESFYGSENLPYLNAIGYTVFRPSEGESSIAPNTYQAYVHQWLTFSLWNPHRNASNPPANGPQRFRILVSDGEGFPSVHGLGPGRSENSSRTFRSTGVNGDRTAGPAWIGFDLAGYNGFTRPQRLGFHGTFTSESIGGDNINDPAGRLLTSRNWDRAGIYLGYSLSPDHEDKVKASAPLREIEGMLPDVIDYHAAKLEWGTPFSIELQYLSGTGAWRTYQMLKGVVPSRDGGGDPYMEPDDPEWARLTAEGILPQFRNAGPLAADQDVYVVASLDPRTTRLNMYPRRGQRITDTFKENTVLTGSLVGPHFPKNAADPQHWVNNNDINNSSYYLDRDRVLRPGDAAGWSGADPMNASATEQKPIRFDRPFRSVGELGYIFRDEPWKTLNFFSEKSADLALLDIFTIGPENAGDNKPSPSVVGGRININSASEDALRAMISGVIKDYNASTPTQVASSVSVSAEIQGLASAIYNHVQDTGPFMNRAELPLIFPQNTSASATHPGRKVQREALIRGVVDEANTRTWNLMVDIIAQAGRFRQSATTLDDFIVEGEKRYWLHLAIDRFTGKVVDTQLEPVNEW